jgi:hypothetical protein
MPDQRLGRTEAPSNQLALTAGEERQQTGSGNVSEPNASVARAPSEPHQPIARSDRSLTRPCAAHASAPRPVSGPFAVAAPTPSDLISIGGAIRDGGGRIATPDRLPEPRGDWRQGWTVTERSVAVRPASVAGFRRFPDVGGVVETGDPFESVPSASRDLDGRRRRQRDLRPVGGPAGDGYTSTGATSAASKSSRT